MGIGWSDEEEVMGHAAEGFQSVRTMFAQESYAQLCVYVDGECVVGEKGTHSHLPGVTRWTCGREGPAPRPTPTPP